MTLSDAHAHADVTKFGWARWRAVTAPSVRWASSGGGLLRMIPFPKLTRRLDATDQVQTILSTSK
jgi:hypothetical protein